MSIEIPCGIGENLWKNTNEALMNLVFPHLQQLYGLSEHEVIGVDSCRTPYAYPVRDIESEAVRGTLGYRAPLNRLYLAGRTGKFEYLVMEGSYASGRECADVVVSDLQGQRG